MQRVRQADLTVGEDGVAGEDVGIPERKTTRLQLLTEPGGEGVEEHLRVVLESDEPAEQSVAEREQHQRDEQTERQDFPDGRVLQVREKTSLERLQGGKPGVNEGGHRNMREVESPVSQQLLLRQQGHRGRSPRATIPSESRSPSRRQTAPELSTGLRSAYSHGREPDR